MAETAAPSASYLITRLIGTFDNRPPDTEYQQGYLAALVETHIAIDPVTKSIASFENDPPDTDFQGGYLAALFEMKRALQLADGTEAPPNPAFVGD